MEVAGKRLFAVLACVATSLAVASCQTLEPGLGCCLTGCLPCRLGCKPCGYGACVCEKPTVKALAHDLDALERHIDKYGSVVTKQPDVWGQARLTKHRQEFESVRAIVEAACDRNAHERCRRFRSAPLTLSFQGARLARYQWNYCV